MAVTPSVPNVTSTDNASLQGQGETVHQREVVAILDEQVLDPTDSTYAVQGEDAEGTSTDRENPLTALVVEEEEDPGP